MSGKGDAEEGVRDLEDAGEELLEVAPLVALGLALVRFGDGGEVIGVQLEEVREPVAGR